MDEVPTRHYYVSINKRIVHLVQYGSDEKIVKYSVEKTDKLANESQNQSLDKNGDDDTKNSPVGRRKVMIFLPGNPGLLGIYHDYLTLLHKTICSRTRSTHQHGNDDPILLAMSHNNFDFPEDCYDKSKQTAEIITIDDKDMIINEQTKGSSERCPNDIELQVSDKLVILKHIIRFNLEDCKLIFVGHSIGCYITLRLLQDNLVASAHQGSILIHPALENLALTEKGQYCARLFAFKVDYLLRSIAYLAEILIPKSLRLSITRRFACPHELVENSSKVFIEALSRVGCSKALYSMIEMSKSEFADIKNIDHSLLIKPHVDRLRFIYAETDHWVNAQNRRELLKEYPSLHIDEQPTMHAFVMDSKAVTDYALKVGMLIQELFD